MNKKHFIFVALSITLLIFSILPIANYIADPSRILHHDYKMRYKKFEPNKLSLKILYLLENKNKYDTLVYGSSRGEFMDASLISKNAYNMNHPFGTVTTYLNSLKTILRSGVKVQNVWIAINDYDIWKDQSNALAKLLYQNNIFDDINLYAESLFTLNPEYIQILKDKIPLIKTEDITKPNERTQRARKQENIIKLQTRRNISPVTLGYNGKFRIKKTIDEISQIKTLCKENNITLTVLMYPIYWKTYLTYDQSNIELFKNELVKVTSFYDFYDLAKVSLDQTNWFEGSHFVPSIGDYMIKSIKKNQNLITKENINSRIEKTRLLTRNMPFIKTGGIYYINNGLKPTLKDKNIIFDMQNKKFTFFKNNDFDIKYKESYIKTVVTGYDPLVILDNTKCNTQQCLLSFTIQSPVETLFQFYYKESEKGQYNKSTPYNYLLKKGLNTLSFIIPSNYINNELKMYFTRGKGEYKIKKFTIHEFE